MFPFNIVEFDDTVRPVGIFKPNLTSRILLEQVSDYLAKISSNLTDEISVLDLGTGSGFVAFELKRKFPSFNIYASDFSPESIEFANETATNKDIELEFRCGDLFEPWGDKTFDVIINDVSGISSELISLGGWFEGVPCETGKDGTLLTEKLLKQANNFLRPNGVVITPLLSLSSTRKIEEIMSNNFISIKMLGEEIIPLPKIDSQMTKLIESLNSQKLIETRHIGGLSFFTVKFFLLGNLIE